jgi:acetoin utilization protein AcuB
MYVRSYMTPNPITITRQTTLVEALQLMRENRIRRLPVVQGDQLVGIVTDRDLSEVSPSPATSLSIFEINYLLAKTSIGDVTPGNQVVHTIEADAFLEEAALLMREHNIGGVPVMEKGRLVGIITETNIFDAFIDMLGFREPGARITLQVPNRPGVIAEVTQIISGYGSNITHIAILRDDMLVLRLNKLEAEDIVSTLREKGYNVINVTRYDQITPRP